jgi:erythromycin esterase
MTRLSALLPALILAAYVSSALAGDPPTLVNAKFERGDAADDKPAGWAQVGIGHEVRTECATACVLHVHGRADASGVGGVSQLIAPGSAAGHVLILSGRIRAEHVDDMAFLAVRVMGAAGMIADHVNGPKLSQGRSNWQQVEVRVPVPSNATGLVINAAMRGKGSIWVDRLALAVDQSVTVPAYVPPVVAPRPQPSQALLDDAALRLAPADMPPIAAAWRVDVQARRRPIRSLFSDDFSDLQFLKPLLQGKRIVQLGEASHGVAESNWAKVRLIKFLHQEMGFDVLAFESSFDQCHEADKQIGTLASREVMRRCLFSIWNTTEVEGLFDYLAAQRKSGKRLALAGFDVQFSGWGLDKTRLRAMLAIADATLGPRVAEHDKELATTNVLTAQRSAALQAFYTELARALSERRAQLQAAGYGAEDIDVEIQTAHARTWLARQRESWDAFDDKAGSTVRDAGMAEQLDFVIDSLYPGRKVIVWAHNMHVTHAAAPGDFISMGQLQAQKRRAGMYTVGFYMGRGMVVDGRNMPSAVPAPPAGTVEAVLANGGLKYAFVDFSQAIPSPSTTWFQEKTTVREFGTVPKQIVPARSYDAIFYIDTVTPAERF